MKEIPKNVLRVASSGTVRAWWGDHEWDGIRTGPSHRLDGPASVNFALDRRTWIVKGIAIRRK